jgi:hypothetical protein
VDGLQLGDQGGQTGALDVLLQYHDVVKVELFLPVDLDVAEIGVTR